MDRFFFLTALATAHVTVVVFHPQSCYSIYHSVGSFIPSSKSALIQIMMSSILLILCFKVVH